MVFAQMFAKPICHICWLGREYKTKDRTGLKADDVNSLLCFFLALRKCLFLTFVAMNKCPFPFGTEKVSLFAFLPLVSSSLFL